MYVSIYSCMYIYNLMIYMCTYIYICIHLCMKCDTMYLLFTSVRTFTFIFKQPHLPHSVSWLITVLLLVNT